MRILHAIVTTLVVATLGLAWAAFPTDPPNDPGWPNAYYARGNNVGIGAPNPSAEYPFATDAEGASGMSIDLAWREGQAEFGAAALGRPDVFVAYMEGGINWHNGGVAELLPKIHLNRAEIEGSPSYASCQAVDNGDPWYNSLDFAHCVPDANGNGMIDAEDVIVFFSDGVDNDGNGYVDDISGWDFYDDQNDPATVDQQYTHCNGQMRTGAAVTNDGMGDAGLCPRCMIMPVKEGAEAIDRTDEMAQAWIFAVDSGAKAFISETADLGYSTFMRQAVEYTWSHDVPGAVSTNDFDSTDHQGGMFWPHVIGCNSLVADSAGQPALPGHPGNYQATSFRRRSGETSWGTRNWISVTTGGGSTSEAGGVMLGVLGLLQSWSLEAVDRGYIASPLTASEIQQVLRASASDVQPPDDVGWPTKPGWDLQTGYGRPNLRRAQQIIAAGNIPPEAWVSAPLWFSLYDPSRDDTITIEGHTAAPRTGAYDWVLEWAAVAGGEPVDADFQPLGGAHETAAHDGVLGSLPLSAVPTAFAESVFHLSDNRIAAEKHLPSTEQYTVTFRLRVTDDMGRMGEERRTVFVHRDPSWFPGFPVESNPDRAGVEGGAKLADLQGQGHLAIIYADDDGLVHALDPLTQHELPGWPVTTDPTPTARDLTADGVDPGHEPVPQPIAVGDLDHDGHLWVVVSSTTGTVYVYDEHGARRSGFPQALDANVTPPSIPRVAVPFSRPPTRGAGASPVLTDMDGDGTLEIVQSSWDGHIHVFRGNGTELPGWPVKVELPASYTPPPGYHTIEDEKLESAPVVANLDDDPQMELVIRSQMSDTLASGIQFNGFGHALAYDTNGAFLWMGTMPATLIYHGSAQEFITEGTSSPVAADVNGDGKDEVAVDPVFSSNIYLFNPDGSLRKTFPTPAVADLTLSFTTSGGFGRFGAGGALAFAQGGVTAASLAGALLTTGSGAAIVNVERAFDAATGLSRPSFPAIAQGLNFLGAPLFADVTGDGAAEILEGGDSQALHAWDASGQQAAGFPKFTSGWTVFSPTVGDLDSDGTVEVVSGTREGYVMAWKTPGLADANTEWWSYRHDEWNTGRYGTDARPPGILRAAHLLADGRTLAFTAPGDDWYAGQVTSYRIVSGMMVADVPAIAAAGADEQVTVPAGINGGTIQGVDDAGNLGRPLAFDLTAGTVDGGQPISGTKLSLHDGRNASRRRLAWLTKDTHISLPSGSDLPTVSGMTLEVRNPTTGETTTLPMPAAAWKLLAKGGFEYSDPSLALGPVRTAVLKAGKLAKITAGGSGITLSLDEPSQGSLSVVLTSGSRRYCTLFGGTVKPDRPGTFVAKNAPAPATCP
jgi:hypothetical protein